MNEKMIDLKNLTIEKAHADLVAGVYTVTELAQAYLNVITEKNADINAYVEVYTDVLDQAKHAEEMFKNGTATILTGIPISIKDNIVIKGKESTGGSDILKGHISIYDATIISELKKSGAVLLGRTNMDDSAMGSSTETSCYGPTKNPLATDRVPGGSSGGPVASVAMDGALAAFASDTGGSIRQPAAYTGLVGLKPTYGTVSRYGLMALASSFDQIGPVAKNVADAEILFNTTNVYDTMDSMSVPIEKRICKKIENNNSGSRVKIIGIPTSWVKGEGIEESIKKNFEETCAKLKNAGYELVDIKLPLTEHSLAVYYIILPAEASSNLARYDGMRYGLSLPCKDLLETYKKTRGVGFGKEVRRRIMLGTYVLSHGYYDAYYGSAVKVQNAIRKEIANVFEKVDLIMTPTAPTLAFKFGEKMNDPMAMKLSDLFTVPANVSGCPAISIPSGKADNNLVHSIQFMAPHFGEELLFEIGKKCEDLLR